MVKSRWQWFGFAIVLILVLLSGCTLLQQPAPRTIAPPPPNPNLLLGNPSNATASNPDNYLMSKDQYVLSYNDSKHIPNWSSWRLDASWLGEAPRSNDFRPDEMLPKGWYRVKSSDYTGSGFDRGHLTPAADRSRSVEDMSATFVLTNILPQAPDNNRGPWEGLESYCRTLVRQGKELHIVAGGYGERKKLTENEISVPDRLWKVIVVLDRSGQGIAGVTARTRVIAVDMPNQQGIKEDDWRKYRVSVAQIEAKTGYNFLSNVSPAVQQAVESRVDTVKD